MNGLNTVSTCQAAATPLLPMLDTFLPDRGPLILGVGRLSPEKGFDRLVDAFREFHSQYPNSALIIVGEGRERPRLEQQIADYGLTNYVRLPGYVAEVASLMKRASVLCIPSLTEGLPIALLEAMSLGVPVVASDVGEIGNVLGQGEGGLVFRYESPLALADTLIAAINDRSTTESRIRWSKQRVEEDFSGRAMMEHYLNIYRQVLT